MAASQEEISLFLIALLITVSLTRDAGVIEGSGTISVSDCSFNNCRGNAASGGVIYGLSGSGSITLNGTNTFTSCLSKTENGGVIAGLSNTSIVLDGVNEFNKYTKDHQVDGRLEWTF